MRLLHAALFVLVTACTTTPDPVDTDDTPSTDTTPDTDPVAETDTEVPVDTDIESPVDTDDTDVPVDTDDVAAGPACDNAADLAALATAQDSIDETAGDCAIGCISSGTPRICNAECVGDAVGLTDDCALCFGSIAVCITNKCALQCINPSSAGCETCRVNNCEPAFVTCSGIQPP